MTQKQPRDGRYRSRGEPLSGPTQNGGGPWLITNLRSVDTKGWETLARRLISRSDNRPKLFKFVSLRKARTA
jgi:hypothetical protein